MLDWNNHRHRCCCPWRVVDNMLWWLLWPCLYLVWLERHLQERGCSMPQQQSMLFSSSVCFLGESSIEEVTDKNNYSSNIVSGHGRPQKATWRSRRQKKIDLWFLRHDKRHLWNVDTWKEVILVEWVNTLRMGGQKRGGGRKFCDLRSTFTVSHDWLIHER